MSRIELVERDFDAFFSVPFEGYGTDSTFVSLMRSDLRRYLDERENPLFDGRGMFTFYTAHRDGRPVGRIVAHIHEASNRLHGLRRGYFGFFDCVDDEEAALQLLGAAEEWTASRGCDDIAGNFNLTAMQQIGVVTGGFEHTPYTDMHYNPSHIPRLLEAGGYERFFPMRTFDTDVSTIEPERLMDDRRRRELESSDIRWSRVRRRGFARCLEEIRDLLNESFARNPMFVPLSREEFHFQAKEMMWIVDHRITQLAYRDDRLIGVTLCIPDLNPLVRATGSRVGLGAPWHFLRYRLNRRRAVIVFFAVRPSRHNQGICGAMLYRLTQDLRAAGYTHVGGTWISDENGASLRQMERLGSTPLHRLHLFRKSLVPGAPGDSGRPRA